MEQTKNCELYLEGNAAARFKEWREGINGLVDSNMHRLDNAIGEKADHSAAVFAVLSSGAWSGIDAPFSLELTIDGLSAEQNGYIFVSQNTTLEQREAARRAMLSVTGQSENKLTFAADGEIPEVDIPVTIILLG